MNLGRTWIVILGTSLTVPAFARVGEVEILHEAGQAGAKSSVVVAGIDRDALRRLADRDDLDQVLFVTVDRGAGERPPISGRCRVDRGVLRFEPRFPFDPGVRYIARYSPDRSPNGGLRLEFTEPEPPETAAAVVERIDPAGDVLPENLLKFYLHFSAPMGRGEVYDRVRIVDGKGKLVEKAFLEVGEELWDASGKRITLLLDPGRIKRGLVPHEEEGPILMAGKRYTLIVDAGWPDATGRPMDRKFEKTFRAGPADRTSPDPANWKIEPVKPGTRDALTISFPEPLDRAMLAHAITLLNADGSRVAGVVAVDDATHWRFKPEKGWSRGDYRLSIDTDLEDLAGNSIARPFEVDAEGPIVRERATRRVERAITITSGR